MLQAPENVLVMVLCRWNRLENLLVQGRKDRDFLAKDALQPVLKLLLGPDGEELRILVIKEAVRVTEAVILGTMIDTYNFVPTPMRTLIVSGNGFGPLMMSDTEQENMIKLRDQVFRIWRLLQSSENFDPALLQPILQVRTNSEFPLCFVLFCPVLDTNHNCQIKRLFGLL